MIQIKEEEIQKYLLAAAKVLGSFCEKNNLIYYLSGGSLLGAVRHHGFIPWDDDIDIMMPREDYEILLKTFSDPIYRITDCDSNNEYASPYARLWDSRTIRNWGQLKQVEMGIYIDILPIDGYPDSLIMSKMRNRYLLFLRKCRLFMMSTKSRDNSKFIALKNWIRKINPYSANDYSKKINKIGRKYSFDTSNYVGVQSGTYHQQKERNSRVIFDHTVYFQFEDTQLPGPSGYDEYLRHLFGDYMQLPPANQRIARHAQNVYLREE